MCVCVCASVHPGDDVSVFLPVHCVVFLPRFRERKTGKITLDKRSDWLRPVSSLRPLTNSRVCVCVQEKLLSVSWEMMSDETRRSLEQQLDCCGLMNSAEKLHVFRTDVKVCTAVRGHVTPHALFY